MLHTHGSALPLEGSGTSWPRRPHSTSGSRTSPAPSLCSWNPKSGTRRSQISWWVETSLFSERWVWKIKHEEGFEKNRQSRKMDSSDLKTILERFILLLELWLSLKSLETQGQYQDFKKLLFFTLLGFTAVDFSCVLQNMEKKQMLLKELKLWNLPKRMDKSETVNGCSEKGFRLNKIRTVHTSPAELICFCCVLMVRNLFFANQLIILFYIFHSKGQHSPEYPESHHLDIWRGREPCSERCLSGSRACSFCRKCPCSELTTPKTESKPKNQRNKRQNFCNCIRAQ